MAVDHAVEDLALRRSCRLLRLRTAARRVTLTYKGPPLPARHKVREELETALITADVGVPATAHLLTDLSARDPYYILPALLGVGMLAGGVLPVYGAVLLALFLAGLAWLLFYKPARTASAPADSGTGTKISVWRRSGTIMPVMPERAQSPANLSRPRA